MTLEGHAGIRPGRFPPSFASYGHQPSLPILLPGRHSFCLPRRPLARYSTGVMKHHLVSPEHPALREKARPLTQEEIGSTYVRQLIADMREILSGEKLGVAIAAPQVGEAVQLFVVSGKVFLDAEGETEAEAAIPEDTVYINPRITKYSRKREDLHEGCLTLPGWWGMVPRASQVRLAYTDTDGKEQERGASGLLAHIFQHECDHLHGVIYTDKAHDLYEEVDEPTEAPANHE